MEKTQEDKTVDNTTSTLEYLNSLNINNLTTVKQCDSVIGKLSKIICENLANTILVQDIQGVMLDVLNKIKQLESDFTADEDHSVTSTIPLVHNKPLIAHKLSIPQLAAFSTFEGDAVKYINYVNSIKNNNRVSDMDMINHIYCYAPPVSPFGDMLDMYVMPRIETISWEQFIHLVKEKYLNPTLKLSAKSKLLKYHWINNENVDINISKFTKLLNQSGTNTSSNDTLQILLNALTSECLKGVLQLVNGDTTNITSYSQLVNLLYKAEYNKILLEDKDNLNKDHHDIHENMSTLYAEHGGKQNTKSKFKSFSRSNTNNDNNKKSQVCKFVITKSGCNKGDTCPFSHSEKDIANAINYSNKNKNKNNDPSNNSSAAKKNQA